MAFLKVTSAEGDVRQHEIDQDEVIIGRGPDCTLHVDDPAASGHHCAVLRDGNHYTIRDLHATNGTFLNGERVTEAPLRRRDVLTIGSAEIMIEGDDVEPPTGPQAVAPRTTRTPAIGKQAQNAASGAFGVRRTRTGLWVTIGVVIAVGLGALIFWFVSGLLKS